MGFNSAFKGLNTRAKVIREGMALKLTRSTKKMAIIWQPGVIILYYLPFFGPTDECGIF